MARFNSPRLNYLKPIIVLILLGFVIYSNKASAQATACANSDFSMGDFTNWVGSYGDNMEVNSAGVYSNIVVGFQQGVTNSLPSTTGRQTLMTAAGTDPNTGGALSVLPPGGAYSVRLGNDLCSGCVGGNPKAQRMEYTYAVTSTNCIFTYQYAVVLQDPGTSHTPPEKPKFTIYVLNGTTIVDSLCGMYEVIASGSIPGFQSCLPASTVCSNTDDIKWKDWTYTSIDLSPYIGKNITVQFTTYDCTLGGHFGYAYISCFCDHKELSQQCSGASDLVYAPPGFANYSWSTGATTSSILIPAPVPVGDTVSCICTAVTGCTVTLYAVLQLQPAVFTVNPATICPGSQATLTVNSAGANTYVWNNGNSGSPITVSPASTTTYTVTGTSGGGCSATAQTTVTVLPLPVGATTSTPTNCGQSNGTIQVNMTVGTTPFQYLWNTGGTTSSLTAIPSGNYSVVVTDANGCVQTINGTVGGSPGPTITGTVINESCAGYSNGSVTTTIGGTVVQPVAYTWSNAATTPNITGLPGGIYTVTVTDAVGCIATNTFTVGSSPIINLTTSGNPEHCGHSDGSVTVVPTGGNGNFTYVWNNSSHNPTVNNIPAGTYIVTVSDGACSATSTVSITNLAGPSVAITSITDDKCNAGNGGATALASGGFPGYNYSWNPSGQTGTSLLNVHSGTYVISVSDTYGCTATNSVTINDTPIPTVSILNSVPANCGYSNGSITAGGNGGTSPYTYLWNNSVTTAANTQLIPGTYFVTVTDANGCTSSVSGVITVLPGPTASAAGTPDICSRCVGSAIVTPNGGHGAPYTYIWSNGQASDNATGLCEGTYTVTVDDGGCKTTTTVGISNIPGPNAYFLANPKVLTIMDGPVSFLDQSSGNIVTWDWTLGDGTTASGTQFTHPYPVVGKYPVTLIVTDANGCKDTVVDTIIVRDIFTIYIPNCFTPTADDVNEFFFPQGINWDPNYFEMYIFDRWGNLMYKSFDQKNDKWNGTLNNSGTKDDAVIDVYVYLIRVKELDGPKHQYIGRVTILK